MLLTLNHPSDYYSPTNFQWKFFAILQDWSSVCKIRNLSDNHYMNAAKLLSNIFVGNEKA
ncbi:hypothetical protein DOY81_004931, partial [Sarcophaga bullata]